MRDSVQALASEMVGVKVTHVGVGPITAFDVDVAASIGACIVAFNVKMADAATDALAKRKAVDVMQHRVIYRLLEEVCLHPPQMCHFALSLLSSPHFCSCSLRILNRNKRASLLYNFGNATPSWCMRKWDVPGPVELFLWPAYLGGLQ